MPAYDIKNTQGATVSIINVGTTTGNAFPVELIGQGISLYGPQTATNFYHLLENFADDIEPTNPVIGMDFYRTDLKIPHFYNGTKFVPYVTGSSTASGAFQMLPTAQNIDMTVAGTVDIFTAPNDGTTFHATSLMLIPTFVDAVSIPPQLGLELDSAEDILENVVCASPTLSTHHFFNIQGTTRFASGSETIKLRITVPATASGLTMDAFLFGFNKE